MPLHQSNHCCLKQNIPILFDCLSEPAIVLHLDSQIDLPLKANLPVELVDSILLNNELRQVDK